MRIHPYNIEMIEGGREETPNLASERPYLFWLARTSNLKYTVITTHPIITILLLTVEEDHTRTHKK